MPDFSEKGFLDKKILSWERREAQYKIPTLEEIREAEGKRLVLVLLVSGDESHDGKKKHVYAVAGLIGTQENWDDLMVLWEKRTEGKPFHAVDCESDKGNYRHSSHDENQNLYIDLVKILAESKIKGFGQAMDIQAWREFFPGKRKSMPFMHCFELVVRHFAEIGSQLKQKIDFTFDHNVEVSHNASYLFHEMIKFNEWEHAEWLGAIKFESKLEKIELQVACLWVRECMKDVYNIIGPTPRDIRKSMQVLVDTGKFQAPHTMDRQYWAYYSTVRVKEINYDEYKKWLKGRQDNLTHKIKYIFAKENKKEDNEIWFQNNSIVTMTR